jgi:ADP-ribose pyrophosphatase YjhB (NUDIX family)
MAKKNSHCSYCGHPFAKDQPWPRTCSACSNTSFLNPLPVSVLLVPVDDGLLVIRRSIPPVGKLALPGGYIGLGESWQEAGAREVFEETRVEVDPAGVSEFRVLSAPDGTVLIFGLASARSSSDLPPFEPTNETSERVILREPEDLAFPLHTQVVREYFGQGGQ